ncbi:MAG TPA: GMC family oxidoreductase N-terminal domain-containing protein [Reyranella sp.]|nr:GMC family oxidoreductase N-terminal domain-containing protein [Reyranella sp.]
MQADYVVVGAGSAGCTVAARLSETGATVILLEAGPTDWYPWIHIPAAMRKLLRNPLVNWNYTTEPEKSSGERRIDWPRGRTLGGTSSINGMLYVRGAPADFDGWAQMGCRGWSYDDVLPFFKKAETYAQKGDPEVRGQDGPLKVEDYRTILPLTHHFVKAAQEAGFPFNPDLNGKQRYGVGYSQMTRRGRWRGSTAQTFLREARKRPNLRVETDAQTGKLLFEGKRCVGVEFRRGGNITKVRANREVIVSGGTVNSPHILQISGIGPAAHLQSLGIPVLHDSPGVGSNLIDHYVIRLVHRVKGARTVNELAKFPGYLPEIPKFFLRGNGALTFGVTTAQVFADSREGLASPDLQLLFTPGSTNTLKFGQLDDKPAMSCVVCVVKPDSRGTVMATSADPFARPAIKPNYLTTRTDELALLGGTRHVRRIFSQPALAPYSLGETSPGPDIRSDDEVLAYARKFGNTLYHPVGTCKMGEDPRAVVDSRLRVHGLQGLRVIDASVMPTLTTGNTNAPTIMIGEKGAEMIKEDARA